MTLFAQKHHECPTCRCTEPLDDDVAQALGRALPLPPQPPLPDDVAGVVKMLRHGSTRPFINDEAADLIEQLARDNQELLANDGKWRWEYEAVMVAIAQKGGTIHAPTQDAYDAVCAARDKWQARAEKAEAEINMLTDANHRQALCINFTASALGPDISATIDGLPKAARHVLNRAEKAEAEVARLREAMAEAKNWHEMHDKALSKQPPSGERNWMRNEHQEQRDALVAALTPKGADHE